MWNIAHICAVLLSNALKTSKAPFPHCLQNVANISRTNVHVSFRNRRWSQSNFSENRNIQGNQRKDMLNKIRGLFFLLPDVVVAASFAENFDLEHPIILRNLVLGWGRARALGTRTRHARQRKEIEETNSRKGVRVIWSEHWRLWWIKMFNKSLIRHSKPLCD